jgi:hypothetical protein
MTSYKTGKSATLVRAGVSFALALAAVGGLATTGQAAVTVTQPVLTPNNSTGATAGGTLTLTLASTAPTKFTSGNVGTQFQIVTGSTPGSCSTNPQTTNAGSVVNATSTRYLNGTKVLVTVGNLTTSGTWLICAYSAATSASGFATSTVLGRGVYIVASAPTVTAVSPSSGPSLGGQTITVTGTNFPTTTGALLTATVGGMPLTGIANITATSFTATTPAHAAGATNVIVTTNGGASATGSGNAFTYQNGIVISPNAVTTGGSVDIDVQGVGFSGLTFNNGGSTDYTDGLSLDLSAHAHVFLVTGAYNAVVSAHKKTNGPVNECIGVIVISDNELICTINTLKSISDDHTSSADLTTETLDTTAATADGTYTLTVVNSDALYANSGAQTTGLTYKSVVSSGATFTVAPF